MSWISKTLTLDLIAIAIDSLQKVFDRINSEPQTLKSEEPAAATPQATQATPAQNEDTLRTQAQEILRAIKQHEGPNWIINELFPRFHTNSLTDVPPEQLPELIKIATDHKATA